MIPEPDRRTIAEMTSDDSLHDPEFMQRYNQLLGEATEQIWQHGCVVLRANDLEILIDYRDR